MFSERYSTQAQCSSIALQELQELLGDKNKGSINGRKSLAMTMASPTNPTIMKTKKKLEKCKIHSRN